MDIGQMLLYYFKESPSPLPKPQLTVDLSKASDKGLVEQYLKVHHRFKRVNHLVKSIEPLNCTVTELARTAYRLRNIWLDVMRKGIHCYKVNAIPSFIGHIFRGKVQVINESGCPIGKPFYIDTANRETETDKHTFRYFYDLLRII